MFKKFFINNIKKRFLQYIVMVLCQLLLFAVILSASGILLDSFIKEEGMDGAAKQFQFRLTDYVHISELYDKLVRFCSECPYDIEFFNLSVSSEDSADNYDEDGFITYIDSACFWPSYRHFQSFMENLKTPSYAMPSEQQFNECQRVIVLGNDNVTTSDGRFAQFKYSDNNHIIIEGEEYLVTGACSGGFSIMLWGKEQKTLVTRCIYFKMADVLTDTRINEVKNLFLDIFGEECDVEPDIIPKFQTLLDFRKNAANIIISLLLIILTVFDIVLIYNQMVMCRKPELAVYSFCGFKRNTCIMYCLTELLILSLFSSIAACMIFDKAIKPTLNEYFNTVSLMFTPEYYIIFVLGYIVFSVLMFLAFVAPTLKKSVSEQLRNI